MAHPSWRLPAPAARIVFGALTVGERLRCREVCPAWRDALDNDPPTWQHLDLRPLAALPFPAQAAVLRAAVARAGGLVQSLALAFESEPREEEFALAMYQEIGMTEEAARQSIQNDVKAFRSFMDDTLLPVLRENSATLQQLSCVDSDGSVAHLMPAVVRELVEAAPALRSLHCGLARTENEAEIAAVLRREAPFAPVRLSDAIIFLSGGDDTLRAIEALKTHDGLAHATLVGGPAMTQEALRWSLEAAAVAKVAHLTVSAATLSCVALAQLVRAGALQELFIAHSDLEPTEEGAAAFADALKENKSLTSLTFLETNLMEDDVRFGTVLMSLISHPTLAHLSIEPNAAPEAHRMRLGGALALLVAADAPALKELSIAGAELGDEAVRLLAPALAANTHLKRLDLSGNGLSMEFLKKTLAPAARACPSLRELPPISGDDGTSLERMLKALQWEAEKEAAAAAQAAGGAQ